MLALALFYLATALLRLGDDRGARSAAEESLAIFRSFDDQWGLALASQVLYNTMMLQRDFAGAREIAAESLAMRRTTGVRYAITTSLLEVADAARQQGDSREALTHYEEALALAREIGVKQDVASALRRLAYFFHGQGDPWRAIPLLQESISISAEIGNTGGVALAVAALAHVAVVTRQPERAARLAGAASTRLGGAGLPSLQPLVQLEYGRGLAAVRAGLDEGAFSAFWNEGLAMPLEAAVADALRKDSWLQSALDDEPAATLPVSPLRPNGLTRREIEVLMLLADGHSNRAIAEALVVSLRTVERHIGSIYGKAGIRGRADATRYALSHGLIPVSDRA